ncbi:MAG: hypothetical protein CVU84_03925 [Firmicutes bacterium HGW-Firmicutes-1]|jgi:hypothetical protein|nr:MAG: hypothetical protein CVU84_03925 [Firmicutes bacterium HGW-Firmicutes-1]
MYFGIAELLPLMKDLSEKYTSKSSTSIPYETAQQLMEAILYCIAENECYSENSEKGQNIIANQNATVSAREAYDRGYKLVVQKIVTSQNLYNEMIVGFNDFSNRAYYDAVTKQIPMFFRWYDARFCPQNNIVEFDYPLLIQMQKHQGIDAIYEYVKCIKYEQQFIQQFQEKYVKEILELSYEGYEELFINLCSPLLKKVLGNMLLDLPLQKTKLEVADYKKMSIIVKENSEDILLEKLYELLKLLIDNVYQGNMEMLYYLQNGIPDIVTELVNGAENNCLEHII